MSAIILFRNGSKKPKNIRYCHLLVKKVDIYSHAHNAANYYKTMQNTSIIYDISKGKKCLLFFPQLHIMKNLQNNEEVKKIDVFEDMREKIGCLYISDLHNHQQQVYLLMKNYDWEIYPRRQLDDLCQYVFHINYNELKSKMKKEVNNEI